MCLDGWGPIHVVACSLCYRGASITRTRTTKKLWRARNSYVTDHSCSIIVIVGIGVQLSFDDNSWPINQFSLRKNKIFVTQKSWNITSHKLRTGSVVPKV